MKYLIFLFFIISLGSIIFGLSSTSVWSQKFIGFGVLGLFFIVFPLFTYHHWKNKNLKDYMLTKENLEKMKNHENKH